MHVKEVTVEFGATINLGNYENLRLNVQIKADMSASEIDDGDLNDLLETARKEVAFGLFDRAEAVLREITKWDIEDEWNENRAIGSSPEYRWLMKLHPDAAKDLLANVVADYWDAKRDSVPVIAPETAKAILNEAIPADVLNGNVDRAAEIIAEALDDDLEEDEPVISVEETEDMIVFKLNDLEDDQDEEDSPF